MHVILQNIKKSFILFLAVNPMISTADQRDIVYSEKLRIFSSPERSPGRAIVLPPALASALALAAASAVA